MTIRFSTGLRDAMLDSTGLKAALTDGLITIYNGSQPALADDAVQGTELMLITESGGAFAYGSPTNGLEFDAPVAGVISKAAAEVWTGLGIAAGTAGWFRFTGNVSDAGGVSTTLVRIDGTVGTSGTDIIISNATIAIGQPNTVDVFQISMNAVV